MNRFQLRTLAIGSLALLIAACSSGEEEREEEPVPVVAQAVRFLPEVSQVEAIGTARAATSAELYPETAGRVTRVLFSAGDYVRSGAPLLELDSRAERLDVEAARVAVQEASQLLGRYRRIEGTGAISDSQIEAGENALAAARVQLRQAQTAVSDRTVRAPFSGHVGLTEIDVGDRVNDSTPITQIDQRGTLYVDFPAPEEVFANLSRGDTVEAVPFSEPGRAIEAEVIATDNRISQDSRDFIVRTAIPNRDDRLRPGMSFRVNFTRNGSTRAAIPEEAIVWGGEGSHLFLVREGKAVRVPVTITSRREGRVFVDGDISRQDRVIVEGVQKVRDGQDIRLVRQARQPERDVRVEDAQGGAASEDVSREETAGGD